jgi:hypothetical protein
MAYYGTLYVGGQEQVSIYDTGSFDVVIESKCLKDEKDAKMFVAAKSKWHCRQGGCASLLRQLKMPLRQVRLRLVRPQLCNE